MQQLKKSNKIILAHNNLGIKNGVLSNNIYYQENQVTDTLLLLSTLLVSTS
eukprot:gene705-384_t